MNASPSSKSRTSNSNSRVIFTPLSGIYTSVFTASLGFGASLYLVPVYAGLLGASYLDLGLIGTARSLPYTFLPILVGYLADKVNRAHLYLISLIFNSVSIGLLAISTSVTQIILIQLIQGVGFSLFFPLSETLTADVTPANQRVKAFGRYSVSWASGFLIGPLLGGFISESQGFPPLFIASALMVAGGFILALTLLTFRYHPQKSLTSSESRFELQTIKQFMPIYLAVIPYSMICSVLVAIFPGYINRLGVGTVEIGILVSIFGLSRAISFTQSEQFSAFGEKKSLTAVALLLFTSLLAIYFSIEFIEFALSMILVGVSLGIFYPITVNRVSQQFPKEKLGKALGMYETIFGIGFTSGPIFAGAIAESLTPDIPYLILAVLALTIIPMTLRLKPSKK